jgi:hypothetical protein
MFFVKKIARSSHDIAKFVAFNAQVVNGIAGDNRVQATVQSRRDAGSKFASELEKNAYIGHVWCPNFAVYRAICCAACCSRVIPMTAIRLRIGSQFNVPVTLGQRIKLSRQVPARKLMLSRFRQTAIDGWQRRFKLKK